tara:strand:+ start:1566 stop:2420 length:855 start_codon:yes stop_codon:yes gene_type:complete
MGNGSARFTMTAVLEGPGLWLIGLGPGDLRHMTSFALSVAEACDKRYLEGYTAILPDDQEEKLGDLVGDWSRVMREDIENPIEIIRQAKNVMVGIMVVGDPMQATTHIDLKIRCRESGVPFHVVPGLSATSLAVSLSGMQSYRFGRQVTIPFPYGDYLPTSPLEIILKNYSNNLHTLVLLDLDPTGMGSAPPEPMVPKQAYEILKAMAERYGEYEGEGNESLSSSISDWNVILLSDIGTSRQRVVSGSLSGISEFAGGMIHCLILPTEFSGMEKEIFESLKADM